MVNMVQPDMATLKPGRRVWVRAVFKGYDETTAEARVRVDGIQEWDAGVTNLSIDADEIRITP